MRARPEDRSALAPRLTAGWLVYAGLMILDGIEYLVAVNARQVTFWMVLLAAPQAWLIARFYMHSRQLRRGGAD